MTTHTYRITIREITHPMSSRTGDIYLVTHDPREAVQWHVGHPTMARFVFTYAEVDGVFSPILSDDIDMGNLSAWEIEHVHVIARIGSYQGRPTFRCTCGAILNDVREDANGEDDYFADVEFLAFTLPDVPPVSPFARRFACYACTAPADAFVPRAGGVTPMCHPCAEHAHVVPRELCSVCSSLVTFREAVYPPSADGTPNLRGQCSHH
jgi:hypothetical protein